MKLPVILFFLFVANITIAQTNCTTDADGDGIADCRDLCPNTPPNARVDMKGCPRDTDGDGVADYKDKELITRQECLPVDSNGVGNCARLKLEAFEDSIIQNSKRVFRFRGDKKVYFFYDKMRTELDAYIPYLIENNKYKISIIGNGTNMIEQQRSWMRVKMLIDYMAGKRIDRNRFCFEYGQSGEPFTVNVRLIKNESDAYCGSIPPPPNPNLK